MKFEDNQFCIKWMQKHFWLQDMQAQTYSNTHEHLHTCKHTTTYVNIHANTQVNIHKHTCEHTQTHIWTHSNTCEHTSTHVNKTLSNKAYPMSLFVHYIIISMQIYAQYAVTLPMLLTTPQVTEECGDIPMVLVQNKIDLVEDAKMRP